MTDLEYRANGKLLLFGEYFVLDGSYALAIPTRFGQTLTCNHFQDQLPGIHWKSKDEHNNIWFECWFDENLHIQHSNNKEVAETLQRIMQSAKQLNPKALNGKQYLEVITTMDFPRDWGLGSSSTLIYLIAQLFQVPAFKLFFLSFKGSGYDVACAGSKRPVIYRLVNRKPEWQEVDLPWPFRKSIYFIYLGKKQDSREGIIHFEKQRGHLGRTGSKLDWVTQKALECRERYEFIYLMEQSEEIISKALLLPMVKQLYFGDFPGTIKSLGSWGGDFIMALAEDPQFDTPDYFFTKGYDTIIPYAQMMLPAQVSH